MLDIKFIRENKDLIAAAAIKKHIKFDVEELIKADDKRKELLQSVEAKRAEANKIAGEIGREKDESKRTQLIVEGKSIKDDLVKDEEELKEAMKSWQMFMVQVPNIPDMTVPDGEDDSGNKEVKVWGDIPTFDFTPKSQADLLIENDMVDFERGAKVAGFRGYFLKNDGALLSFALWQFVQQFFVKKGFNFVLPPIKLKREPFIGTGFLPQSEEDLYKTQDGEYLAGTAEVPMMGYFMDEIIDKKNFPLKYIAFSPCYRREAGSHGKDTRGLIRVHEFYKFEQVILCEANHETSVAMHEEITKNAEELMQALKIPYHVVINCGGDLGLGQVKKYDIEAWVPSEQKYRETNSSSYFHDFQTRRLNIRYKDEDGTTRFAHSLNNTAAATPRLLVSIIENFQQADGSIKVPEVLIPYMGRDIIGKRT